MCGTALGASIPPITQSELADMIGGTRQSVNGALRGLEERGHIQADGKTIKTIRILDREALRRRASG